MALLRIIASSSLCLLLVVTLLWGGCISCPQFFMFSAGERNCCNQGGQCQRPTKTVPVKECKRMPLENKDIASIHVKFEAAVLVHDIPRVALLKNPEPRVVEHPPPDLNLLYSTLLI